MSKVMSIMPEAITDDEIYAQFIYHHACVDRLAKQLDFKWISLHSFEDEDHETVYTASRGFSDNDEDDMIAMFGELIYATMED